MDKAIKQLAKRKLDVFFSKYSKEVPCEEIDKYIKKIEKELKRIGLKKRGNLNKTSLVNKLVLGFLSHNQADLAFSEFNKILGKAFEIKDFENKFNDYVTHINNEVSASLSESPAIETNKPIYVQKVEQGTLRESENKWIDKCNELIEKEFKKELKQINGVFLPDNAFYTDSSGVALLQNMATQILTWLNCPIKKNELKLDFRDDMDAPGIYTTENGQKTILINSKHKNDKLALGAILAHELMHFYLLGKKGIFFEDQLTNELLTDLCTIKFGLGVPIINGMSYSNWWPITLIGLAFGFLVWHEEKNSFGYFKPKTYGKYFVTDLENKKINTKEIKGYVRPASRSFLSLGLFHFLNTKPKTKKLWLPIMISNIWNYTKIIIIFLIVLFFIWISLSTEPSYVSNQYNYGNNYDNRTQGQYSCSEYDNNQADLLTPSKREEQQLISEGEALENRNNELERLNAEINSLSVDENSFQWEIDNYNKKVTEYNIKLQSFTSDATSLKARMQRYFDQIDNYNQYLIDHCTKNY